MAMFEARTGTIDQAIERLRRSLSLIPGQANLHWLLANFLAERGDTSELKQQIESLKNLHYSPILISFLEAYLEVNLTHWTQARQFLVKLQPAFESAPEFKARVNNLLARCYSHLGDREREGEAYLRAARANPQSLPARLGLAASMIDRGEIDQAIDEYRSLNKLNVAQVRGPLVRLLIAQNQQLSAEKRDWTEVTDLIKASAEAQPQSSEVVIMRAALLQAQGKVDEARILLDQERSRAPKNISLWVASAEILTRQGKFNDAQLLLDQAEQAVGRKVEIQIERARLLVSRGGADLSKALASLAQTPTTNSPEDQRRLLETLALEATKLNDLELATQLWTEVAQKNLNDLEPQLRLIALAFQTKNVAEIEKRIEEIKRIDGPDGPVSRYQEIRLTIWNAQNAKDPAEQAKLRGTARSYAHRAEHKATGLVFDPAGAG